MHKCNITLNPVVNCNYATKDTTPQHSTSQQIMIRLNKVELPTACGTVHKRIQLCVFKCEKLHYVGLHGGYYNTKWRLLPVIIVNNSIDNWSIEISNSSFGSGSWVYNYTFSIYFSNKMLVKNLKFIPRRKQFAYENRGAKATRERATTQAADKSLMNFCRRKALDMQSIHPLNL